MAEQLWKGRFSKAVDSRVNDFNSSISFDSRMYKEDITGSIAHARMLGNTGIIDKDESLKIIDGLIKTETDRAAIVTHGGVMMALLTNFGLPQLPMHEWITPNGCGYTLRITPSLWMRGHKLEVVYEFPYEKNDEDGEEE